MERLMGLRFTAPGRTGPVAHDPRLDGIRGLAALSVMMVHGFWFDAGPSVPPILKPNEYILSLHMSRAAVFLFFVTSGYVIGLTNRQAYTGDLAKEYLRRRSLRIVPIYLVAIIAGWMAYRNVSPWTVLGNALFLQNPAWHIQILPGDLPLWSLHNEVVYYLGFLLLWRLQPRVLPLALIMLSLSMADWFFGGPISFLGGWATGGLFWITGLLLAWNRSPSRPQAEMPILSLVLLAYATNHLWPGVALLRGFGFPYAGASTIWFSDLVLLPVTAVLFCAVLGLDFPGLRSVRWIAMTIPLATALLLQMMGRLWGNAPWTLAGVATIAAFVLLPFEQRRWGEAFFRLFRPLGGISYGLYLFHVPCVVLISMLYPWSGRWPNYIGGFLTWFVVTLLVAWVCEARMQPALLSYYKRRFAAR
jgi:peptidoglycan/LPS O-acetylase OafA/YrhL